MGKRKCAVKDCTSEEGRTEDLGVTFHRLPSNVNNRQKWIELCQIELDHKQLFVCSRHFLKADFGNFKAKFMLKPKIVPSIFPWTKKPPVNYDTENLNLISPSNTLTEDILQNKRIRKKKLNPDYITSFTRNEKVLNTSCGSKSTDDEGLMQFEDSTSADLPPVLEPAASTIPQSELNIDKIPNLVPSATLDTSINDNSAKSKKRIRKPKLPGGESPGELPSPRKKVKSKGKEKEKLAMVNSLPGTSANPSIIKDKIMVEDKCTPSEISKADATPGKEKPGVDKELVNAPDTESEPQPPLVNQSTTIEQNIEQVDTSTGLLTFEPNTRIEALDINQTWSPATIVEVDYEENEVLVHFDSYSNKYDEWIGINSSSIRAPSSGQEIAKRQTDADATFQVGERCMAYWADTKKFPATVKEVVDHETYVVHFDDGYIQQLHVSKMTKSATLFMPAKGSKEERRAKKRKLNVQTLFNKRMKKSASLDATVTDDGSSADETPMNPNDGAGYFDRDNIWYPNFDEHGAPVGVPSQLKSKTGIRGSVIVPDPNLPPNWEKHVVQREGGKFYSVIVTPDDKKLRCSSDIQRYIMDHPDLNYQDYRLDFNVIPRNSRAVYANTARNRERVLSYDRSLVERDISPPPAAKNDLMKILQVDGGFQCPIEGCGKCFRRENLVQMHVKHYHPEFTKFLDSTPNVLDLVYQRLHGDDFEHSPPGRSYDSYYKRGTLTPMEESGDTPEFDYQKDVELKKLLNTSATADAGGFESTGSGSAEGKLRDVMSSDSGPDLKSLVVTTKSGLKTIPPVKKALSVDMPDGNKKRKADELEEYSEVDGGGELELPLGMLQQTHIVLDHIIGEDGKMIKIEQMRKEEIIHCTCGITEEDGLMIQCEICMCWQHAHCNNIYRETEVPEKYVCFTCLNPQRQRSSMKYKHDQDWLKHGRLPTGGFHCRDDEANRKRFEDLRKSHDISGGLIELKDYMHTLKQKIKIAEMKNHPKLYLWSKPWKKSFPKEEVPQAEQKQDAPLDEIKPEEKVECESATSIVVSSCGAPEPEAPIETADCRINLLQHILHSQSLIGLRLTNFEQQMNDLAVCGDSKSAQEDEQEDSRLRLTTSMLIGDLGKLRELAQLI